MHVWQAVLRLFGRSALALSWGQVLRLSTEEVQLLGFQRVDSTDYVYRNSARQCAYDQQDWDDLDPCFEATPEHEAWVQGAWESD
jgi:hypothetical protein